MDDRKNIIYSVFSTQKMMITSLLKLMDVGVTLKSDKASSTARQCGNDLFLQKNHDYRTHKKIFAYYCKSIATAPSKSEHLISAFANRSAFLLHIKKYQDCISDIEKALNLIDSNTLLKVKLLCRQAECLKKLNLPLHLDILEEAENCMNKIDINSKDTCVKLINKVKKMSSSDTSSTFEEKNSLSETIDILNHVTINHTNDYGRHLCAAQDYKPGDIIFVEKSYVSNVFPEKSCVLCNYCLKYAWSGIPCDQCDWAMFCSEECKMQACKEFHDIECTLIPHLQAVGKSLLAYYHVSLRLLIVGLKEAGSIAKLKEILKNVDDCRDICCRGFYQNGNFVSNTIQSVYSLNYDRLIHTQNEAVALGVILILIGVVKYSKLIDDMEFKNLNDLMNGEDFMFLAALLFKLISIKSNNAFSFPDKRSKECEESDVSKDCMSDSCCERGAGLFTLASLMNHSCFPNVSRCFTEDLKIVVYALQPIKKSSQIFTSYSVIYYYTPLVERKAMLEKYQFECNCEACSHDWPPFLAMSKEELVQKDYLIKHSHEKEICDECADMFVALHNRNDNFHNGTIKKLSKYIELAASMEQPTLFMALLLECLNSVFPRIYGIKFTLFDECKF